MGQNSQEENVAKVVAATSGEGFLVVLIFSYGSVPATRKLFGATVCKTVRPMLSDRCRSVCLSCNVGVLWQNGLMDQDATLYEGKLRPRRHCVRWVPTLPTVRGTATAAPHSSVHIYYGITAVHLSNC